MKATEEGVQGSTPPTVEHAVSTAWFQAKGAVSGAAIKSRTAPDLTYRHKSGPLMPALGKQKQEDLLSFCTSLVYAVSSRRASQGLVAVSKKGWRWMEVTWKNLRLTFFNSFILVFKDQRQVPQHQPIRKPRKASQRKPHMPLSASESWDTIVPWDCTWDPPASVSHVPNKLVSCLNTHYRSCRELEL